jgi:outer membrane immunogenic protein
MRFVTMIAAAAAFVGSVAVANAADLSYKDTPHYSPAPAPVWGGLYVGGHIGGLWTGDHERDARKKECKEWERSGCSWICSGFVWKETDKVKFEEEDDDVSLIGGVHVGYNWQRDAVVFGVEADVSFADNIDYLASLRGRLGYASGNFLIYATAGVALAQFADDSVNFSIGNKSFALDSGSDDAEVGFVVGGGVEYKVRPNWSIGLEGLYYIFDDSSSEAVVRKHGKVYKVTEEDDNDFWVARARLSYHFQSEDAIEPLK